MERNKQPSVSVVIPVRGRVNELQQVLECLRVQTMAADEFEILVCDDGSAADASETIRSACRLYPHTRYLWQPHKGPAAARNYGVACARADIIAFTDSDTLPQPQWLEEITKPFSDPVVISVEGPVITPRPAASPLEEAPVNNGGAHLTANMAYRRQILAQVGGLDECFPLPAFEDTDLALCVRELGIMAWAPEAVVVHPWRKVGLMASIRRLRQFDWLLLTALRHGCLGWVHRPTKRPRLRVALAAAITMPLGRFRKGMRFLLSSPADACRRMAISIVEASIGLALLPRWFWRRYPVERRRYLDGVLT